MAAAMSSSIIAKESEVILTEVLDSYDTVKACGLCQQLFGAPGALGTPRKVMSACAFQKGSNVSAARRKSCIVCDECVASDQEGTGHVGNKGKCRVCIEVKNIEPKLACYATVPATEITELTKIFTSLHAAREENSTRLEKQDEEQQTEAANGQRAAATAAQDTAAQRRGFVDRKAELDFRAAEMTRAKSHKLLPFDGSTWDEFTNWKQMVQSLEAEAAAKHERDVAKAAEAAAKAEVEKQRQAAAAATLAAENERAQAAANAAAAAEERKAAIEAAKQAARDEVAATLAAGIPAAPAAAAAGAPAAKRPRTQESKDVATQRRQDNVSNVERVRSGMQEMANTLAFRAPTGLTTATKAIQDVGEYRLDGKMTKDSISEHVGGFLGRANTKINAEVEELDRHIRRGNALYGALRTTLAQQMTTALGPDAPDKDVEGAVDAKLVAMGLCAVSTFCCPRLLTEEEEEEWQTHSADDDDEEAALPGEGAGEEEAVDADEDDEDGAVVD